MSKRKRVNKDTGKLEYKARYFWIDENGKKKDSDTGWFPSKAEAYIEAERLRKEKSSGAIQKKTEQLNNSIEEAFGEWIAYLNEKMSNDTDGTYYLSIRNKARSLIKHHTPEEIKNTKIKNITLNTFRIWVNWVNDEDIAGKTVRGFKQTMRYFNKYLDSRAKKEPSFMDLVSARMPFGFPNTYKGEKTKSHQDDLSIYVSGNDREIRGTKAYVPVKEVKRGTEYIDKHKVYISKAGSGSDVFPHPILTKPFYGEPHSVCNESYLVIGPFNNQDECENVMNIKEKSKEKNVGEFIRFLRFIEFYHLTILVKKFL